MSGFSPQGVAEYDQDRAFVADLVDTYRRYTLRMPPSAALGGVVKALSDQFPGSDQLLLGYLALAVQMAAGVSTR